MDRKTTADLYSADGAISIINILKANIRENNPIKSEDYIDNDGLLMCGLCNTAKEHDVELTIKGETKLFRMPTACECEARKFEAAQKELKQSKIENLRRKFIPDAEYREHRFEKDDSTESVNSKISRKYADKWEYMLKGNKGLLFRGTVGTGKSYYACCIANAVIDKGYGAIVTTIPRLKTKLGNFSVRNEVWEDITEIPLLIIDDFGVESDTSTSTEQTTAIFDTRYKSGKPMIITTNLTSEEMQDPKKVSPRTADRIFQMCQLQVEFKGVSRRIDIAERSRQEMYKLLSE